jgi:hypothetical protein
MATGKGKPKSRDGTRRGENGTLQRFRNVEVMACPPFGNRTTE